MKPEGRKPYKQHTAKHHVTKKDGRGWWEGEIEPNKARARREAEKEIEQIMQDTLEEELNRFIEERKRYFMVVDTDSEEDIQSLHDVLKEEGLEMSKGELKIRALIMQGKLKEKIDEYTKRKN